MDPVDPMAVVRTVVVQMVAVPAAAREVVPDRLLVKFSKLP